MKSIKVNNRKGLLKIRLDDMNGKPILNNKGEEVYWTFDLQDIELVGVWSEVVETEEKLRKDMQKQLLIIEKRQDVKGKYSDSKNTEDSLELYKKHFIKTMENMNRFLGENGVQKFLGDRKPYWNMFEDIAEAIEQILPLFDETIEGFKDDVKKKYGEIDKTILE